MDAHSPVAIRSLKTSALLPVWFVLLCGVVLALTIGWYQSQSIKNHGQLQARNITLQMQLLYAQHAGDATDRRLQNKFADLSKSLSAQNIDTWIIIRDNDSNLVYKNRQQAPPENHSTQVTSTLTSLLQGRQSVEVYIDLQHQLALLHRRIALALLALAIFTWIAIATITKIHRRLRDNITKFVHVFSEYETSEFSTRLVVDGPAEIMHLQQRINQLTRNLNDEKNALNKQVTAATEELNQSMEEVEIKNVELDLARKRAVDSNEAKSTFLANISHEIRSPMNGIIGHLQLLQRLPSTTQHATYVENTLMAANALLDIIDDTLNLSRIEANKLDIQTLPFDLLDEVSRCLQMLAPAAVEKKLDVYFINDPELPEIFYGDSLRIRQVMTNLISNAIKYTPSGSIQIRIDATQKSSNKFDIRMEVADTGMGMDSAQIDSLFEAFSQAGRSPESGTGLGLLITRSLTEAMGGELELVSEKNKGSTFTVRLTLAAMNPAQAGTRSRQPPVKGYVDCSNDLARQNYERVLHNCGVKLVDPNMEQADLALKVLTHTDIEYFEKNQIDIKLLCRQAGGDHVVLISTDNINLINQLNLNLSCEALPLHSHSRDIAMALGRLLDPSRKEAQPGDKVPLTSPAPDSVVHEQDITETKGIEGYRVLLADDDRFGRTYMTELLTQHGLWVDSCANGEEAVERVMQARYDLILMDIRMPVCDGIEATRRIREIPHAMHTPVIGMTASVVPEQHQQCVSVGMNDYWIKPLEISQLISGLGHWLRSGIEDTTITKFKRTDNKRLSDIVAALDADMRELLEEELALYQNQIASSVTPDTDLSDLREAVHRLNGCAAICRLTDLNTAANALENSARIGDYSRVPDQLQSLNVEISRVRNSLSRAPSVKTSEM